MESDAIRVMTIEQIIGRYPEVKIVQEVVNEKFPGWELTSLACPGRRGYETWSIKKGDESRLVSVHLSTRTILDEGELYRAKKYSEPPADA